MTKSGFILYFTA